MNPIGKTLFAAGLAAALTSGAFAADVGEGAARAGEGTKDVVTSPGKIVDGISEETEEHGAVAGTVTGTAKGTVDAAGQAVKGAANVGVGAAEAGAGVVEKILEPLTGD